MIRKRSSRSVWTTTRVLRFTDLPMITNRLSFSEWIGSAIVKDKGSPKTVTASSKDTPCFLRFWTALCWSHSKFNDTLSPKVGIFYPLLSLICLPGLTEQASCPPILRSSSLVIGHSINIQRSNHLIKPGLWTREITSCDGPSFRLVGRQMKVMSKYWKTFSASRSSLRFSQHSQGIEVWRNKYRERPPKIVP